MMRYNNKRKPKKMSVNHYSAIGEIITDPTYEDDEIGTEKISFALWIKGGNRNESDDNMEMIIHCEAFGACAKNTVKYAQNGALVHVFGSILRKNIYHLDYRSGIPELYLKVKQCMILKGARRKDELS